MSFVLNYRKTELSREIAAKPRVPDDGAPRPEGRALPAEPKRAHRLSVLGALLIAGLVLAVFNSGGLVNYAYDFSQSALGIRVLELTERWHGLMQEKKMTRVVEGIRSAVTTMRQTSWEDLWLAAAQIAENAEPERPSAPAQDTYVSAAGQTRP